MTQGSQFGFFTITQDNAPSPEELTMYNLSSCLNVICQVKFQLLGLYFEATDLPDLKIQGSAGLRFVNNGKVLTEKYRRCRKEDRRRGEARRRRAFLFLSKLSVQERKFAI